MRAASGNPWCTARPGRYRPTMTGPSFPNIEAALQRILRPLPDAFRELAQDEARTDEARQDFHAAADALDRALRHLADSK